MATGTMRFWAAARAAAGVAEEPYDAPTLAVALADARARHDDRFASVLQRCSFVVDEAPVGDRPHESVLLTDGGSVEVLPPFAGGSESASPALLPGVAAGAVAAALAGLALLGMGALVAGLAVVQVVLALAWLAALDVPGGGGPFVIVVMAAGVMDGVLATESEPDIGRAAGVVGVAVVLGLLYQLARRPRVAVTLSFASTLAGVVFALCAASYVALHIEAGGDLADAAALLGAGAALAAARLTDRLLPRPVVVAGSRRGVAGLVVGMGAAVLAGWAYGSGRAEIGTDHGIRLAAVAAVIALVADLAVDAVLHGAPPSDDRSRAALPPLGILLPVVLAGPAAYVAGRILLG